ncbi:MAG: dihydrofolate reductase [Burkholderiales bacterium]
MTQRVSIIAAVANGIIGIDNRLPWRIPADLKRFKALTMGHHIVMGRKTFQSIGKPLPGRISVIVTRDPSYRAPESCTVANSIDEAIAACGQDDEIFFIGGAEVYKMALRFASRLYLTEIHYQDSAQASFFKEFEGDTYLPRIDFSKWRELERKPCALGKQTTFTGYFVTYDRTARSG